MDWWGSTWETDKFSYLIYVELCRSLSVTGFCHRKSLTESPQGSSTLSHCRIAFIFKAEEYPIVCINHIFFIHSSVGGDLHFSTSYEWYCNQHRGASISEILISNLLRKYSEVELLKHTFVLFHFLRNFHTAPQRPHHFTFPSTLWRILHTLTYTCNLFFG